MTDKEIQEKCKECGEESVGRLKDWNGYKVYEFWTEHGSGVNYDGYPILFLVEKNGNGRFATGEETIEIYNRGEEGLMDS